jgi:putative endonuclease
VELRHVETFESKSAAMSREYEVKQLSRRAKARLIDTDAEDGDDAGPRSAPDSGDA